MNIILHVNKEQNEWEITIKGTIGERTDKNLDYYIQVGYHYLFGAVALVVERLVEVKRREKKVDEMEAIIAVLREMNLPDYPAVAHSGSGQQVSGADRGPTGH